ncbi:ADP-ribosylglycohydrolase family protein [Desulfurobacterium atlanticum]|uniref:ADP-ribosylglycohydrolase n=1 Tax=Desulfurobacterium atlanticum TaxID=240169 RepID=A0A238ZI83_9BACT|nr:ADP-ribosylglycohydrolase family protein [Desulfurobacterium atlanticum]SNR83155.1 ADP-ribosylglycohydrolase [Desulfurobacterium atlanticum]
MEIDLLKKIKGTVFGGAIGDALGTLVEEMDKYTVKKAYGGPILGFREPSDLSVCPFLRLGHYSHETQMFLIALEVYAEKGRFDETFYVEKMVEWLKDEKNHRYPAGGHLNAALAYKQGAFPDEARVKSSEVDGVIPAVAAGLYGWDSSEEAYNEGCQVVSLIYSDEILVDSAGILAVAISSIAGGRVFLEMEDGKIEFLEMLRSFSQIEMVRSYIDLVMNTLMEGVEDIDELILRFGNGNFVLEPLSLSLYVFLRWGKDFRTAVLKAVNAYGEFGGDTDAIGFLTGAFSGCYNGIDAIPSEWIEKIENRNYLNLLSEKFFEKIKNG